MAKQTDGNLLRRVIYSVFVRNHTPEGSFEAVIPDLPRIKALGVDIVWLMPIHPLGKKNRKGSLGSPYAISDYRAVNPEYGDMEGLKKLVAAIHGQGMKCIIDVVYNHTSPDSWLAQNHPEWFYKTPKGEMGNRCGDWSDVVDLDYDNRDLWEYQIETLQQWAQYVDGFRCDVASLVPVEFWLEARKRVDALQPPATAAHLYAPGQSGRIWLAESVHTSFVRHNRKLGFLCHSDDEMYRAFDICYDYDIRGEFDEYVADRIPLEKYVACVKKQRDIYPENHIKLRFLENHDQPRAKHLFPEMERLINLTAYMYLVKGTALIYAGQEDCMDHQPSLFDKDTLVWSGRNELSGLIRKLYDIRQIDAFAQGVFDISAKKNMIHMSYSCPGGELEIWINTTAQPVELESTAPDGVYTNLINGGQIHISSGRMRNDGLPVAFQHSI